MTFARRIVVVVGFLLGITCSLDPSGAAAQGIDQDHALVKRYPGAEIMGGGGDARDDPALPSTPPPGATAPGS